MPNSARKRLVPLASVVVPLLLLLLVVAVAQAQRSDEVVSQDQTPEGLVTIEAVETSPGVWQYTRKLNGVVQERRPATEREAQAFNVRKGWQEAEVREAELDALLAAIAASPSLNPEIHVLQDAVLLLAERSY